MSTGKTFYLATADGLVIAANGYNGVAASGYGGGVYALDRGTGKLQWTAVAPFAVGLAVAGGTVYAGTAIKDNLTGGVTALHTGTGEVLWTYDFPTNVDIDGGVAVADGVVYATTSHGEIYALGGKNGNVLWRVANPAITFTTGLLVVDGVVYVCSAHDKQDNANPVFYALQARTGHQLWQRPLGASPYSAGFDVYQGVVFAGINRKVITSKAPASEVFALNAATGQPLWNVQLAENLTTITAGPGNVIYTGNNHGLLDAWQASTGNHLWSYHAAGTFDAGISVHGGVAYFGGSDRRVYAVAAH
jgi:outer membrane protein assembly factor BamB